MSPPHQQVEYPPPPPILVLLTTTISSSQTPVIQLARHTSRVNTGPLLWLIPVQQGPALAFQGKTVTGITTILTVAYPQQLYQLQHLQPQYQWQRPQLCPYHQPQLPHVRKLVIHLLSKSIGYVKFFSSTTDMLSPKQYSEWYNNCWVQYNSRPKWWNGRRRGNQVCWFRVFTRIQFLFRSQIWCMQFIKHFYMNVTDVYHIWMMLCKHLKLYVPFISFCIMFLVYSLYTLAPWYHPQLLRNYLYFTSATCYISTTNNTT